MLGPRQLALLVEFFTNFSVLGPQYNIVEPRHCDVPDSIIMNYSHQNCLSLFLTVKFQISNLLLPLFIQHNLIDLHFEHIVNCCTTKTHITLIKTTACPGVIALTGSSKVTRSAWSFSRFTKLSYLLAISKFSCTFKTLI